MYRVIDGDTWGDPWFSERSGSAKLLFLYLITNPRTRPSGVCEVTTRQIGFETGLSNIPALIDELGDRIVWWPDHHMVWVRNFYRHQCRLSHSQKFRVAAVRSLAGLPSDVITRVVDEYPELHPTSDSQSAGGDTLSIPYPYPIHTLGDKETGTGTGIGTDQEQGESSADAPEPARAKPRTPIPDDFEPSADDRAWAASRGLDGAEVERETEKFVLHYQFHGSAMKDWHRGWRNWIVKMPEFRRNGREPPPAGLDPAKYKDGAHLRVPGR